jgi:predicted RNA-binding Zn-ribbon protein involved in translation (DUF1610 family)
MNTVAEGLARGLRLPDLRPTVEWAENNVILPGSPLGEDFERETVPMLIEPLNAFDDPLVRRLSVLGPTQCAKTGLFQVILTRILSQDPGNVMFTAQTDDDSKFGFRTKLLPTLKQSKATAPIIRAARQHEVTNSGIILPPMFIETQGPNLQSLQSKTIRYLLNDEVWMYDKGANKGAIGQLRERVSAVWNSKEVNVSQGGQQIYDIYGEPAWDEWGWVWHEGTQEIYHFVCPECGNPFEPRTKNIVWETSDRTRTKSGEWKWDEVAESVRVKCPHCGHEERDTLGNRRDFSRGGLYIQTNEHPKPKTKSFQYSAYTAWWQEWGALVVQYLTAKAAAKRGNRVPAREFWQKKEARFWMIEFEEKAEVVRREPSGYTQKDYWPFDKEMPSNDRSTDWGEQLPKEMVPRWIEKTEAEGQPKVIEVARKMTVDRQADVLKVLIRLFSPKGTRAVLYRTVPGWDDVRRLQLAYRVPNGFVGVDCGDLPQDVYATCKKYGWWGLRGSGQNEWRHVQKAGRPLKKPYGEASKGFITTSATGEFAWYYEWSNLVFKDWLQQMVDGRTDTRWEIPDDAPKEYVIGLTSEAKDPKTGIWKKIGKRPNHAWDCEAMQLPLACITGTLATVDGPGDAKG